MTLTTIISYILIVLAGVSAFSILFIKEVFHASLALLICLLCVAGIYIVLNAEFIAVVQLIVYAAGVLLLILFGIMLTVRHNLNPLEAMSKNTYVTAVVGISLFSLLVYGLNGQHETSSSTTDLSPAAIGKTLMTAYAAPFELAGILLLISLVGAIVAATHGRKKGL